MFAWLQFASGAVEHDNTVPLEGQNTIAFLDLMFQAGGDDLESRGERCCWRRSSVGYGICLSRNSRTALLNPAGFSRFGR
jgi:hypothetical protein